MKPNNQNFGSNFSENMTESVKLADYMANESEANIHNTFMKYAAGGRNNQYDVSEEKVEMKYEIMPDIKPIKTDHSQVSGVGGFQNAFTKKTNNIQTITNLRHEYEQIRNIRAPERKVQQKMSSSGSSSSRSNPNGDPSSSSLSRSKINKKDGNLRQQRLWQVQRKQYEYMLNNCQQKIEQLLHSEMQYKKIIHELRSTSFLYKQPTIDIKSEQQLKQLQRQLREEKQKNYKITVELQKIKISSKQQLDKLTKIQSEYNYRAKDQSKLNQDRRRLQENIRLEKDRYLNCQIQKRKYQMENQLLLKDKEQQANRVQRQIQHLNALHLLNVQNLTKKYNEEIEIKDRRYMLLVSQYEKLKKQYANTKAQVQKSAANANNTNSTSNTIFEIMKRLIEERRNSNPNEELTKTVKDLMQRLKPNEDDYYHQNQKWNYPSSPSINDNVGDHNQGNQKLLSQIRMLKAQIEALRNTGDGIDLEPMKRMYEAEIAALKDTINILERKLKNIPKQESPSSQKDQPSSPIRNKQIQRLQRRIRQLQQSTQLKAQKSFSMQQHEQQLQKQKSKIDQIQQQLRNQRRTRNEVQFQVTKLRKQLQFRSTIMLNQNQSKLRIKQQQLDRANNNINQWRQQFQNMKSFYQSKLRDKNVLLENQLNKTSMEEVRKKYQESMEQAKSQYQRQIRAITQRLSNYNKESLQYDALLKKYTALQASYYDLQKNIFKGKQINDGVDHLWQIKQTEYGNVYQILRQLGHVKSLTSQFIPTGEVRPIENAIYGNFNSNFGQGVPIAGSQVSGGYMSSQNIIAQPTVIVSQPPPQPQPQLQQQIIYSQVPQPINPSFVQINQPIVRSSSQFGTIQSNSMAPPTPPGPFSNPAVLHQALNSPSGPYANIQTLNNARSETNLQRPASNIYNTNTITPQRASQTSQFVSDPRYASTSNGLNAPLNRPTSQGSTYLDQNYGTRASNPIYA